LALFSQRAGYLAGARAITETPLIATNPEFSQDDWYRVAAGKGVLVLHELRRMLGEEHFKQMMEQFGKEHAGKQVSTADFIAAASKTAGKPMKQFFDFWLGSIGLPAYQLEQVATSKAGQAYSVTGVLATDRAAPGTKVDVTVEAGKAEETRTVTLEGPRTHFKIETKDRPERVVVDKYGWTAKSNGGVFALFTFQHDLPQTLIVYGTADEVATNREAAETLQRLIVESGSNFTVPVKSDREVTDDELKSHHLLLIGRPDTNRCVERFRGALPVEFGSRSFKVNQESYAHAGSAVMAAGENPLNPRYSVVVLAGLSPEATWQTPAKLLERGPFGGAEVVVLPQTGRPKPLIVPARELARDLGDQKAEGSRPKSVSSRQ
jgi:hypothetical protein